MKKIITCLLLSLFLLPSLVTTLRAQNSLTRIEVKSVPDNYGPETPDLFFILKDGNNVVHTSFVQESDPPVVWTLSLVLDSTKNYTVEVWDDDSPLTANDDMGTVTIPGTGTGTVIGTVAGASGQLELYYEYTVGVGVDEGINSLNGLTVFPNPSDGHFSLELDVASPDLYMLEVFDMRGSRVHNQSLEAIVGVLEEPLDLSVCESGLYVLRLRTKEGQISRMLYIR